jgi:hypothetical protein
MYAIEFKTKIRNGIIEIPEKFRSQLKETVRVILLTESAMGANDIIEELLKSPLKINDFKPYKRDEIYDRV